MLVTDFSSRVTRPFVVLWFGITLWRLGRHSSITTRFFTSIFSVRLFISILLGKTLQLCESRIFWQDSRVLLLLKKQSMLGCGTSLLWSFLTNCRGTCCLPEQ